MQQLALGDSLFLLPLQMSCVLTIPTATSMPRKSATRWRFYSRIRNRSRRSKSWRDRPGRWKSTTLDEDGISRELPPRPPISPGGVAGVGTPSLGSGIHAREVSRLPEFQRCGYRSLEPHSFIKRGPVPPPPFGWGCRRDVEAKLVWESAACSLV